MPVLLIILIFFFGTCIGSFVNALVYRLKENKKIINDRSICPNCKHLLGWKDLVPILSFALLKGKCRYCQAKISWQYPGVEIITGLLFVLVYLVVDPQMFCSWSPLLYCYIAILLFYFIFTTVLILIFIYDLKYYLILDKITIPAIIVAFLFQSIFIFLNFKNNTQLLITNYQLLFFSAIIGGGFFLLQFLVSSGRWIGGGDIRLGALMGVLLSWPGILIALFVSYVLGSMVSLCLLGFKKKKINSAIPFGTFLTAGTFITLLWGGKILTWYLGLIGY